MGDVGVVGEEVGDAGVGVENAGGAVASDGGLGEVSRVVGQGDAGQPKRSPPALTPP